MDEARALPAWDLRRAGIERIKLGQTTLEEIASATTAD